MLIDLLIYIHKNDITLMDLIENQQFHWLRVKITSVKLK